MRYEKPILEILYLDVTNIVATSLKDGVFEGDDYISGDEFQNKILPYVMVYNSNLDTRLRLFSFYGAIKKGGDCVELIQEYLALVIDIVSPKESKEKVYFADFSKEHNRKVTRMRKIAAEIEQKYPELKSEFCKMLSHENAGVRIWVAHHVLEVMNCDKAYRKAALKEIRNQARTDKTANGFGEKVWLKEWYKSHPKDRWI